jgi:hypothetical protein
MTALADIGIRRVREAADWDIARTLRFEGLVGRGEIGDGPARAFGDAFDDAPGTITYLLCRDDVPLGTTRSTVTAPGVRAALPSSRVFGRELEGAFGRDAVVVEASLTFVDPRAARDPQDALMRLFKVHMWRCAAENSDALVVAVRESQMGFYRRRFNMEILSGAEHWPGMATPRVLMGLAWRDRARELLRRIPALAASAEDEAAFARL